MSCAALLCVVVCCSVLFCPIDGLFHRHQNQPFTYLLRQELVYGFENCLQFNDVAISVFESLKIDFRPVE